MFDLTEVFKMQKELDAGIYKKHQLDAVEVFNKKKLAFLVELGETANDWRAFKYWSLNRESKPSMKEEFIDMLHFAVSICLDFGLKDTKFEKSELRYKEDISESFILVISDLIYLDLNMHKKEQAYLTGSAKVFLRSFLGLAYKLEFTQESLMIEYKKKNETNWNRQKDGY